MLSYSEGPPQLTSAHPAPWRSFWRCVWGWDGGRGLPGPQESPWTPKLLWEGVSCHGARGTHLPPTKINWVRLIGLISCSGPTGPSLVSGSPCSQHPMEHPHGHGPLLMRDRHNCGGFYAGIWPPGPAAAASAEMWGFGAPQEPTELLLPLWAAPLPSWQGQQAPFLPDCARPLLRAH